MKTVLFVVPSLQGGGAERVIVQVINHLDRERFVPLLALGAAEGPYLKDVRDDVQIHVLGARRARRALPAVVKVVRAQRPDTVFSTLGLNLAVAAARPLLPRGTRVVLREGNSPSAFLDDVRRTRPALARLYRRAYRHVYGSVDRVICQSDFMRNDLVGLGVPTRVLTRIYNPVDGERVRRLGRRRPDGFDKGLNLVAVGRFDYQKGYDILIGAFADVRKERSDVTLWLVGDGAERSKLERFATDLGLTDAIVFAGFSDNPYPYIAHADLFVSSSRYEGLSNVILEAMACGTPVVATDCPGGNREVLQEGVTGWLAAASGPSALAEAIRLGLDEGHSLAAGTIRDACEAQHAVKRIVERYEAEL